MTKGAALFGRMGRFPKGHRLRRWDPEYTGGHVVFVENLAAWDPAHVTERFAGQASYADCGPTSAIMLARADRGSNAIPDTKTEVLAFRKAAGASANGYTSNLQIEQGLRYRYNVTVETVLRFPAIHAEMGSPTYYHWHDPLAPKTIRDRRTGTIRTYTGERVTAAEVNTFLGGPYATIGRTGLITPVMAAKPAQEGDPMILLFETTYKLAPGVKLYQQPSLTAALVGTLGAEATVKSVGTPYSGSTPSSFRAIRWMTGVPDGGTPKEKAVYVRAADCTPV